MGSRGNGGMKYVHAVIITMILVGVIVLVLAKLYQ